MADDFGPRLNGTPAGRGQGIARCPQCGSSEVTLAGGEARLECAHCRHEWELREIDGPMGLSEGLGELSGTVLSSAAVAIESDDALVTLKCGGCGAEVMIDTSHALSATCHWCRRTLSLNARVPNGAVPDGILPFTFSRQKAWKKVAEVLADSSWFVPRDFIHQAGAASLQGVYLPYMTVDVRATARLDGAGAVRGPAESEETRPASHGSSRVSRTIEVVVDDLIVESNRENADRWSAVQTSNVINAVLPYDVKEAVRFDAAILGAEHSVQRRDLDVAQLERVVAGHVLDLARREVEPSIAQYRGGVRWENEQLRVDGARWTSVLLPVWLYAYRGWSPDGEITSFVAVNGRNGTTAAALPVDRGRVAFASAGAGAVAMTAGAMLIAGLVTGMPT